MANVLDLLKDAAIKDLDEREYQHATQLLKNVSPSHILYKPTKEMLESVRPNPMRQPSVLDKAINSTKYPLMWLSRQDYFPKLVVNVALAYGTVTFAAGIFFLAGATLPDSKHLTGILQGDESDLIGALSAFISTILTAAAAYRYVGGKIRKAYKYFEQSLLVNIFFGQIVLFFKSQAIALAWLAVTLLLLINLELLSAEKTRHQSKKTV